MPESKGKLGKNFPFFSLHFFSHFFISPLISYLSLYIMNKGITQQELGIIMACAPAFSILGQYIWSNRADKSRSINMVLFFITLAALLLTPLFFVATSFWHFLIILAVQNFFLNAVCPLADTLSIHYASQHNMEFGRMRLMGSIGYLFCMLLCGWLTGYLLESIFYVQMAAGVLLLAMLPTLPKVQVKRLQKTVFNPFPILKEHPAVVMTLVVGFVMFFTMGIHWSFFAPYLVNELGAPSFYIGLCAFVSIACEVVFLLNLNKLIRRFNLKYLLFAGAMLMVIRWFVYGATTNFIAIILFSCADGITAIFLNYLLAIYLNEIIPGEGKVSLLMLTPILTSGIGKVTGSLFGPMLITAVGGMKNCYTVLSIGVFIVSMIFLLSRVKFKNFSEIRPDNQTAA